MKNRENFKKKCDDLTDLMESCFDENNPEDGLTFDERLEKKLNEPGKEGLKTLFENHIKWGMFMSFLIYVIFLSLIGILGAMALSFLIIRFEGVI